MADQDLNAASSDVNEKPTTHAKKAQIVAVVLIVVVFLGLFAQTWINMSNRSEKQEKAEAAELKREAQAKPREPAKLNDFEEAQRKAEAEIKAKSAKQSEDEQRKKLLESVANRTAAPNSSGSSGSSDGEYRPQITAQTVKHEAEMADMKRALEASWGKMGVAKRGQPGPEGVQSASGPAGSTAASSELARVNAEMKRLQAIPAQIAERNKELIAQAQSMGITLPPTVLAQASVPGSGAPNAAKQVGGLIPAAAPVPAAKPGAGFPTFGELAQNRVARDPANAGPRPGEEVMPTGSVISAVMDMDMMSDYDGNWKAVLQRPFYDVRLENILLPAGTKIVGKSFRVSRVNEAIQNRMGATPLWAIRPDGKRIDFKRTAGVDAAGVAALQDIVDRHVLAQIFGVGAYAIIGLGPSTQSFGTEPNSAPDAAVREATAQARLLGRNFAEKYLSIVPTVTIRAGTPIKIFVEDDIYVTPWAPVDSAHFAAVR
ncbi:hypothetical protein EGT07_23755 [Herbaspirillum sp. HC18]|nr:hypothetical protein EGT07_23755 [Herbaspirillum sp. HC18]